MNFVVKKLDFFDSKIEMVSSAVAAMLDELRSSGTVCCLASGRHCDQHSHSVGDPVRLTSLIPWQAVE